ncbi:MAG: hypothetical protein HPY76_12615 [Anaerolineae bacterium]|jgi:hypothetical protein|nr:hypothetical protein [Anaerolineae bacterium]
MKKVTGFCILMILSLVSCTTTATQIPATSIVLSNTPTKTPAPTETPEATPTEIDYRVQPLIIKDQSELVDSRVSALVSGVVRNPSSEWEDWVKGLKYDGFTRTRFTLNFSDGPAVDFSYAFIENGLPDDYIDLFRQMKDLGIKSRYSLSFWDMAHRQTGGTISHNRLSTEGEIDRYLTYVEMVATSLKGLVDSYELWNEPDANYDFYQRIEAEDYLRIARLAIPLIREIDPQAKIVLVSTSSYTDENTPEYSMKILQSDVIALADAISLHTVNNDASPVFRSEYYYGYDAMWKDIKQVAEANGFHGEYFADELNYRSDYSLNTLQPEPGNYHPYEPEIAAKYIGRMIAINLGMDISVGTSGTNAIERPFEGKMIRNMAFLFDGLQAYPFHVDVQSESNFVRYYTFVDDIGNKYIAVWHDGEAKLVSDNFAGSISVADTSAISVTALDPFNSTMQAMRFTNVENQVLIEDIALTDYPIIYQIMVR